MTWRAINHQILTTRSSLAAPTGLSNVVQMFETAQVLCARHSLEACDPELKFREVTPEQTSDGGLLVPGERRSRQEGY